MSGSKYGLIVPKKGVLQPRHSVFGDDSSDEAGVGDAGAAAARPHARKAKAVPELDSSLLQYDEYHDELQRERAEKQQKARKEGAQARYIPLLMQHAERRKKEAERRAERLIQKEREAEGDQFHDKETFVTSSYRKKVEEFAKMDAEDKRQDRIEELADVTKQKDLGAFYGSLYKQTVGVNHDKVKVELEDGEDKSKMKDGKASAKKSRHYRKRKNSPSSEEHSDDANGNGRDVLTTQGRKVQEDSEGKQVQIPVGRRNEERLKSSSKRKKSREASKSRVEDGAGSSRDVNNVDGGDKESASRKCVESGSEEGEIREEDEEKKLNNTEDMTKGEVSVMENTECVKDVVVPQVEEKVDIWEKHTVGEVFEAAVQRYWQRKAARDAARAVTK